MCFGVEAEECLGCFLCYFHWFGFSFAHEAFGVAACPMRVNREDIAIKMPTGKANLAQSYLQMLCLGDGVSIEHVMDGRVGGNVGQTASQGKIALGQAPLCANARNTQR